MLTSLAYLLAPERLGTVVLYRLNEDFAEAWSQLPRYRDNDTSKPIRPAYAGLATALSAVTNQPIVIMPDTDTMPDDDRALPTVLATTKPIAPRLLTRAVRSWEQLIHGGTDANTLSPLLAQSEMDKPKLGSFIRDAASGRPRAPQWFYRVAAWNFAAALAREPLHLPAGTADAGRRLEWLIDTRGSLLAWDHVLKGKTERPARIGYAMHKLDFRVITLPGEPRIGIHVLPTFSRLATHWAGTRTAFVERGKNNTVLRLPVGHRRAGEGWEPYARNFAAQVVAACNLEAIQLGTNETLAEVKESSVRALVPGPTEHPLGKGTGTRFNLYLAHHVKKAAAKLKVEQLVYERTDVEVVRHTKGPVAREDLDHALSGTGQDQVRVLALYDDEYTRERMITALTPYLEEPEQTEDWGDNRDHRLTERLCVQLRRLPALTSPTPADWNRELSFLVPLSSTMLTGVWVETIWNPKKRTPRRGQPDVYDPKQDLRRHFHRRGAVSQFIAQRPRPKPPKPEDEDGLSQDSELSADLQAMAGDLDLEPQVGEEAKKPKRKRPRLDYPAINGLRDLMFRLGAVDGRLAEGVPLDRPTILVGLHLRQQRVSAKFGSADKTQMVEVLTALHTDPDPNKPWRLEMYSRRDHAWLPLPQGEAAFGAGPIGVDQHARHKEGAALVREHIKAALRILPGQTPLVIFVDTEACRTIWPGLQHAQLGEATLPSEGLDDNGRSVAVVSINTSYGEVPTPVDRADARGRRDPARPQAPDDWLHERTTSTGVTSWYFAQKSRSYDGFGQTAINGSTFTRFTIPEDQKEALLRKDWHSFTATQITVPQPGMHQPKDLAALAAALCHQSLAWDARTRHPVPLHVAGGVDRNHPEYRGSSFETETEQPGEDAS
ncbi:MULTISPECIES: RNaseH domain-containing protein [unclassified Streptomyces]|uniref:RNaseH domain-containing protein n=1 Tax=unclassified Streptomyces TaxID=2593676 RepID=UPI00225635D9|nr:MULTISPECIES: RNaseH domain-containing protein [unclassified Streptomyces]MCX4398881.1 RNaseH domain-containing protein [Streptomyces sp. NBC_01767]WSP51169.1 RNaseH domain-containing protein [Streptomyces sp. NBC_01243]